MPVALPGADQAEVGGDGLLEHVGALHPVDGEVARVLGRGGHRHGAVAVVAQGHAALGDLGARAGDRVERRDARAPGAQLLRERALRGQLDLELAGQVLPLELLVLPDVGRDHPADPLVAQQDAQAPVVDAAVVGHDLEAAHAAQVQLADQHARDAAQPEPAHGERRAVRDVRHGVRGAGHDLVHAGPPPARGCLRATVVPGRRGRSGAPRQAGASETCRRARGGRYGVVMIAPDAADGGNDNRVIGRVSCY